MIDVEHFWASRVPFWDIVAPTPASAERVRGWEENHGVRLPTMLATALAVEDGGSIRGTDITLFPLDWITEQDEGVFRFGTEDLMGVYLIFDYTSGTEPLVMWVPDRFSHPDERQPLPGVKTFEDLVRYGRDRGCQARIC